MKLPRFLANIVRKGAEPELVTTRNFDDLASVLTKYATEIEGQSGLISSLATKVGNLISPAIWGKGAVWDVKAFGNSIATAVSYLGSTTATLYITNTQTIAANLTTPSNISIVVLKGGGFTSSNASRITINGPFESHRAQAFFGDLLVTFGDNSVDYILAQWWGCVAGSGNNSGAALQRAIDCAQLSNVTMLLTDKFYTGQTLTFVKGAGPSRLSIKTTNFYKGGIGVVDSVSTGSPLTAILEYDPSGGSLEACTFEEIWLDCNGGRANYGLKGTNVGGAAKLNSSKFRHVRASGFAVGGITTDGWQIAFDRPTFRDGTGAGLWFREGENNDVTITDPQIFSITGVAIKDEGGQGLNILGGVIELCTETGVIMGLARRGCHIIGTYFERNASTGYDLTVSGTPRTIKADVIVNGQSLAAMGRSNLPCRAITFDGCTHATLGGMAAYAYYLIGVQGVRIPSAFVNTSPLAPGYKLVATYGDTEIARPEDIQIGPVSNFLHIAKITYSSLAVGTFTVGEYLGNYSGSALTSIAKVLADNGTDTAYVECPKDFLSSATGLRSATLSGSTFTVGAVSATLATAAYRPRHVWVDGGAVAYRPHLFGTLSAFGMFQRNYWQTRLLYTDFTDLGYLAAKAFTGSTAAADTIQCVGHGLYDGDRHYLDRTGVPTGTVAHGMTDTSVDYYAIRVDADNFQIALTEADALAGTQVDITGDIGAGTMSPRGGSIKLEATQYNRWDVHTIYQKVRSLGLTSEWGIEIDLDDPEFEELRGQLVYFGAYTKQSHTQMRGRMFVTGSTHSSDTGNFSTNTEWQWQEFYGEMPFTGVVRFKFGFIGSTGVATAFALSIANPVISLVGAPRQNYHIEESTLARL